MRRRGFWSRLCVEASQNLLCDFELFASPFRNFFPTSEMRTCTTQFLWVV